MDAATTIRRESKAAAKDAPPTHPDLWERGYQGDTTVSSTPEEVSVAVDEPAPPARTTDRDHAQSRFVELMEEQRPRFRRSTGARGSKSRAAQDCSQCDQPSGS